MTTRAPSSRPGHSATAPRGERPCVAYIMSRFPKITETFVLYEMRALEELGARVEVFPLLRQPAGPRHPEAEAYEERAHFTPFASWSVVQANARRLFREPRRYVGAWLDALLATWGSLKFFTGAVVYFPKCVAFAERMDKIGVTHVHAHFANHPALASFIVHRLTGIPYSFTAHGSDLHVDRRGLAAKVQDAAFVVAVSAYNRELIVEECGEHVRDKVRVIHCGTDPATFARAEEEDEGATVERQDAGPLRIVCVASFEEVKGHRFLLEACSLLRDRGVDVHLDLAGDGPRRQDVEHRITQLKLADRVTVHGAVPRPEIKRILAASQVAVLASYPTRSGKREGIPVALMEAMTAALPVVASGVSGIPELVDHERTGFLVPPGDPWALADRLEQLAEEPLLRRNLGVAGRNKVLEEFDLRRGASLLLEEIERASRSSVR